MANRPLHQFSLRPGRPGARGRGVAGALPEGADPGTWLTAGLRELAREMPLAVTVRGDCMAPRLRDGDRIEVAPAARYWPGDVVAFRTPQGRMAVHRLLGYRLCSGRWVCLTQGDRCDLPDSPLAPERQAIPLDAQQAEHLELEWGEGGLEHLDGRPATAEDR